MSSAWIRKGAVRRSALGFALKVYAPFRLALSAIALLVRVLYRGDLSPDAVFRPYLGVSPVRGGWRDLVVGVWQRWDTLWYIVIARDGYSLEDTRIFAPPLYPWLARLAGSLLGGGDTAFLLGGLIVSNLACIALFAYFYALAEREWGTALARRAVVYLALFPTAFFLVAAYSESLLYTLCGRGALSRPKGSELPQAVGCRLLVGVPGAPGEAARGILVVPLAVEFARQWRQSRASERPLAWWKAWPLFLPVLGALVYPLYVRFVLGADSLWAPFAIHQQRFAGRFAMPWQSVWQALRVLALGEFRWIEPIDLSLTLLFAGLTVAAFVYLPLVYAVYMAAVLAGALAKFGPVQPLLSLSRYVLALVPGFVLLARVGRRSAWWNRAIVYPSVALQILLAGQFVLWGWVG